MHQKRITVPEYERDLPPAFNPVKYDPAAWVAMAKAAGMKYITITSKHHDGFAMYDSKVSDYDVVERTPYGKDVLKLLADECRKEGIKLFFYHSQLDWHHPDYFPRGRTGRFAGRDEKGDWNRYLDYMDAQLRGAADRLRRDRRHLVRRLVGQARGRVAARADLQAHPRPAARGARGQQPPPQALPRRGLPDVREGPARPEHHRLQRQGRDRRPADRDVRHDQQLLGLQQDRRQLQEHEADRAPPGEVRRATTRNLLLNVGPAPRRHDPARVREAAGRGGRLAEGERRDRLRHPRRADARRGRGA